MILDITYVELHSNEHSGKINGRFVGRGGRCTGGDNGE